MKHILEIYFDFHYGKACALEVLIFCIYLTCIKKKGQFTINKILAGTLFAMYIAVLIGGTVLNREFGSCVDMDLTPFWSYREVFLQQNVDVTIQIVSNVIVFIPWGVIMAVTFSSMKHITWNVIGAMASSMTVELAQFVLKCGKCELDDVFHNTLGAAIGYGIWKLGSIIREKYVKV